jgi:hypothetical protein
LTLFEDINTQLEHWSPRLVYCFLLAFGIWVSMLRQQKFRQTASSTGRLVRLRRIAGVWTFYAIIQIWNEVLPGVDMVMRFEFFASLFGL